MADRPASTSGPRRDTADFKRPASPARERPDREDMVWFRISIGREHNADPRWLLPLICRAGDVTKSEIGVIRIFDRDSRFQIAQDHAERFAASVKASPQKQGHIARVSNKHGDGDGASGGHDGAPTVAANANAPEGEVVANAHARPSYAKPSGFKPDGAKSKGFKPSYGKPNDFKSNDFKSKGPNKYGKPGAPSAGKLAFNKDKAPYKKKPHAATGA